MNKDWITCKISNVCSVIGGATPKTNVPENWNGTHYWITPAELDGTKWINGSERTLTDTGVKSAHLSLLPTGTVLLTSRAPIGKVAITQVPMYCNQGFKNIVCGKHLINEYVYWFLKYNVPYIQSLGTGATFKEVSKKIVENIEISYPSLPEQQHIVEELDTLSGIIEKQKEQLKQLDALAQSIFYDMFGDPMANEKGWEIKMLGDLFDIGSSKRVFEAQWRDAGVPFYRAREIVKLSKGEKIENPLFIERDLFEKYKQKYGVPQKEDIMITGVGTLGICYLVNDSFEFYFKDGNIIWLKSKDLCLSRFIVDQFSTEYVKEQVMGNANACVVGTYTITNAKKTKVILPSLHLQEVYVKKIEKIEQQKSLIKQSIKETEELFNSRMDYYFN